MANRSPHPTSAVAVALIVSLSGCATGGQYGRHTRELRPGLTTQDEVLRLLGKPRQTIQEAQNTGTTLVYIEQKRAVGEATLAGAMGTGAGLAVAGLILQAVFSNPLCEPYTLGISSGAAIGAVLALSSPWAGFFAAVGVPA